MAAGRWPTAAAAAIGRTVTEIGEADGDIGSSSVRLKRGIGADLTCCHSDVMTTVRYIHVLNRGPEDVRSEVDGF